MLNVCQTTRANNLGHHFDVGWELFADKILDAVDKYGGATISKQSGRPQGVVFLAWGRKARALVAKLDKVCHQVAALHHCPDFVRQSIWF